MGGCVESPSGLAGSASSPHSGAPFLAGFARANGLPSQGRWPSVSDGRKGSGRARYSASFKICGKKIPTTLLTCGKFRVTI